jgi:effector-binding domain-containing protein
MDVEVRDLTAQPAAVVRARIPATDLGGWIGRTLPPLQQRVSAAGAGTGSRPFLMTHGRPDGGEIEVSIGVPLEHPVESIPEAELVELPGGPAAVHVYKGPYQGLPAIYPELAEWIRQSGYRGAESPREVYVSDPAVTPSGELVTEVIWPLR